MKVKVITSGRGEIEGLKDYFNAVLMVEKKLVHTPVLAFVVDGESVRVEVVEKPLLIYGYPDSTPMMGQWMGKWRSDFFQFTAGDFKQHADKKGYVPA
jgi:hypothetical protein